MLSVSLARRRLAAVVATLALVTAAGVAGSPALATGASPSSATATIALEAAELMVLADGSSTVEVTATVTDLEGTGAGHDVALESSDSGHVFTPPTDGGDGTYTATLTSTTATGPATLTARLANGQSATTTVWQVSSMPRSFQVISNPGFVNFGEPRTIRAELVGLDGLVDGAPVTMSSTGGNLVSEVVNTGDGVYEATLTPLGPLNVIQQVHYGVMGTSIDRSGNFTPRAGAPAVMTVELSKPSIAADGTSTTTATARLTDAFDHPKGYETVTFTTDGGQSIGTVTGHGDGTYSAEVRASTLAGVSTITATLDDDPTVSGSATLTQTLVVGPPADITATLDPPAILGDGVATTTLTARVTDADSNPVPGAPVVIETRDQYVTNPISAVTDHGDGTYSATVTSTVAVGIAPLQARVEGTSLVAAVDLDQVAVPPLTVQLHLVSDEVVADGADMASLQIFVEDAAGNRADSDMTLTSDRGNAIDAPLRMSRGTYWADVTATTVAGISTITVTLPNGASDTLELREVAGPPAALTLEVDELVATVPTTTTAPSGMTRPRRTTVRRPTTAPSRTRIWLRRART